ncbi:4-oxalomesaconate tautomerase [compost metagenome]
MDVLDGVPVTCIDMAMPMMLVQARHLGVTGAETPAELDANRQLLDRLEALRLQAGKAMGLGDVSGMVIPKPVLVSAPRYDGTLQVRYFMPHNCHRALAITGAVGLATACVSPGTVIGELLGEAAQQLTQVRLEHPGGGIDVALSRSGADGKTIQASVVRTARRLFSGFVYAPTLRRLAG